MVRVIGRHEKNKSQASRYRHYVDFQSKTETGDGQGGFTEVWEDIIGATQIPIEITPLKAERREEMRSWNVIATHQIKSRSDIPIEEVGRVVYVTTKGTRYFYIHHLEDLQELGVELFMLAEERRT